MAKKVLKDFDLVEAPPAPPDPPAGRVHHTVSTDDLYQGPTPKGPWSRCEELPAPERKGQESPRRAWSVTDKFTHLGK